MIPFEAFKSKEKFNEDLKSYYPGAASRKVKKQLTERINLAADDFAAVASGEAPTQEEYLDAIDKALERFTDIYIDTEDREQVGFYFEELMDIVDLESSEGKLNNFLYGFDIDSVLRPKP